MIAFTSVTKQYGGQILFVDASFQINPGEKVGLVGPNGAGKSTVFRLIAGEEAPDDGASSSPRKLTLGYFRQDVGDLQGPLDPRRDLRRRRRGRRARRGARAS